MPRKLDVWSCIMSGLPEYLVQELNGGTLLIIYNSLSSTVWLSDLRVMPGLPALKINVSL